MLSVCSGYTRRRAVVFATCRRSHSSSLDEFLLPPHEDWRKHFPTAARIYQNRISLSNPDTAALVANSFVTKKAVAKTIIEIFPGPGQLTRALLNLPKKRIEKLIVLEHVPEYLKYLKPLEAADSRLQVVPIPGESWESYQTLQDMGLLNHIRTVPWNEGAHPQLQFISHLPPSVPGEQFISQLFRSIPDQQWLFKYGRVPMSFLLSEYIWNRIVGDDLGIRCKLTMVAKAVARCEEAVPYDELQPYGDHFHPRPTAGAQAVRAKQKEDTKLLQGKPGNPFLAINSFPLELQAIRPGLLDKWDYCLRRLYVRRATPLKTALSYLAPNAQSLLKKLDPELAKRPIREMSVEEWASLIKAFDEWPFAPEDLAITDNIGYDDEKRG
ncbi:S-adenosyl-L-methionine-dependent methyltransferase [Mycena rebaudengoi]|nr:S-adenosyl-L-methionine-dependent methyltransferase [Mycena rebaudengoi]